MSDEESYEYRVEIEDLIEKLGDWPLNERFFYQNRVTSPMDLVQKQRFLQEAKAEFSLGKPTSCDALIFGFDEPDHRYVTKVGGLPYWKIGKEWPKAADGSPLEFLVQFNFAGSRDILPDLPGDLLSVFVHQHVYEMREFYCEWQSLDVKASLITQNQIPSVTYPLVATPAYAVACRVDDFPDARPLAKDIVFSDWNALTIVHGSKIGGTPSYKFDVPPCTTGVFICALDSLRHPTNIPWPFVNVEEPLTPEIIGGFGLNGGRGCHDTVKFADEGTLHFYLQGDGSIRILLQSWSCEEYLITHCSGSRAT